ncbi:MAG TPA: hypothetical protein ACFYD6_05790 [Candidatus Brocadiia bacterium]|nr:hypothetical protein [Planctomycetota bacterium]MBI4006947.1 hypothetical protein [Planctomycetota bacterium]MDO8091999.1 hypothetical protein [Candidatus Brocadiales bacterium]
MKKDKVLGHDPLSWIKATREAESKQVGEISKPEEQETSGLEATHQEVKKPVDVEDTKIEEIKKSPPVEQSRGVRGLESGVWSRESGPRTQDSGLKTLMPYSTTRTNGSPIIFIIAYAVLLLILTFFVYFNLSKRIDDIGSRISNMERALNLMFKETDIIH